MFKAMRASSADACTTCRTHTNRHQGYHQERQQRHTHLRPTAPGLRTALMEGHAEQAHGGGQTGPSAWGRVTTMGSFGMPLQTRAANMAHWVDGGYVVAGALDDTLDVYCYVCGIYERQVAHAPAVDALMQSPKHLRPSPRTPAATCRPFDPVRHLRMWRGEPKAQTGPRWRPGAWCWVRPPWRLASPWARLARPLQVSRRPTRSKGLLVAAGALGCSPRCSMSASPHLDPPPTWILLLLLNPLACRVQRRPSVSVLFRTPCTIILAFTHTTHLECVVYQRRSGISYRCTTKPMHHLFPCANHAVGGPTL